ncbi:MAG: hypothetical protein ACE144_20690 [Thermodesulfobacteriota bacterium]
MNKLPQKCVGQRHPQRQVEPPPIGRRPCEQHTYLQVGDKVFHKKYRAWGGGIVIETWSSDLPGGLCYVRIQFQDGKKRVFDNSFESACCCYYAGITLLNRIAL